MLDVHANLTTPGAVLVLGNPGAVAVGDGAQTAGVPIGPDAQLRMWGFQAPTADSIANVKLTSLDMNDPVNGITFTPGAASLLCQHFDYTKLPYKKGPRLITAGTNVGVVAGTSYLIDEYSGGKCVKVDPGSGGEIMVGAITFGGALTANQWGSVAWTPTNVIPEGEYAILGAFVTALTNVALVRFVHNSFQGYKPGFPVVDAELALATTMQIGARDDLVMTQAGEQFVYLSEKLKTACCPVFKVTNAGTGLSVEVIAAQACTPVINLVIARVG
jgi:hypothetical protein